ncbi:MAG: metal-dependent phosphohydrolase [Planctomycetaceae bacterium]|nr:metal-dependent phosphohydrolase [Planctomycetaceae bacterium]
MATFSEWLLSMQLTNANLNKEFATQVVDQLKSAGYEALWAGGCVRDFLLGRQPDDFDVATSAHPEQVRDVFGRRRTLAVGASFGVIVVLGSKDAGQIEVATFRTDGEYLDGRHPESVTFGSAKEDAQRRDFTINGMFYDPVAEQILDFVGGEDDLKRRVIRAIGCPRDRFGEDKLRMLRAIRFTSTLNFELDEATATAVSELASEIHAVSAERITHELKKMQRNRNRHRAISMIHQLGLLPHILPELTSVADDEARWTTLLQALEFLEDASFELACGLLLSGTPSRVQKICKRLKMSNAENDHIAALAEHRDALDGARGFSKSRLKRLLVNPWASDLIALTRSCKTARNEEVADIDFAEEFLRSTPAEVIDPKPLIHGGDLMNAGLQPGPEFKVVLEQIRDAQLDETIQTRDEALKLLSEVIEGLST